MAIKKSQLYSTLWESCNALRGSMDASQYKDYVLMMLFVKYLSDKARQDQTRLRVPEGCFFDDFVRLKQNPRIGELMNEKLEAIKEANVPFIGTLTLPNFNDPSKLGEGKTMIETLSKLIGVFQNDALDFSQNRAADDDLLGDAYEYLMKNFAAESGKSKGQFYTPAEVSRVMAKILHLEDFHRASDSIYDPTCGSGSLLLRALDETPRHNVSLRGQEKDSTTASLAKLNMLLHGVISARIEIGDTLNDPKFTTAGLLDTFDVCVANPPFSTKDWLNAEGENDRFHRWSETMLPPEKSGDYAFLLHLVASMKEGTGRGACILPHGVLFRSNCEAEIRKKMVDSHQLKGIIGLPANLFYGTGIPACILIFDKRDAQSRKGIFMIDAKDGYKKDGNKNRLREQDIRCIVDCWNAQLDVPHYAKMVSFEEIEKNEYNLNIPRYIPARDQKIQQDIDAHLHGGLPEYDIIELTHYWEACPDLKDTLFSDFRPGYYKLRIERNDISERINTHPSVLEQKLLLTELTRVWFNDHFIPEVSAFEKNGFNPKVEIDKLGTLLLDCVRDAHLTEAYGIYNTFMDYCVEIMQDDFYIIHAEGWAVTQTPVYKLDKNKDKQLTGYSYDPLTDELLIKVYFQDLQDSLTAAEQKVAESQGVIDTFVEENSEDGDWLDDNRFARFRVRKKVKGQIIEEEGKLNRKNAEKRLEELCGGRWIGKLVQKKADALAGEAKNEYTVLVKYLDLMDELDKLKKQQREAFTALYNAVGKKYDFFYSNRELDSVQAELKHLLIYDKWIDAIQEGIEMEMNRAIQTLVSSVTTLVERYEFTLSDIDKEVDTNEEKVMKHLAQMGFEL